jgi:hypothetical protein
MAEKFHLVTQQPDPNRRRWEWEIYCNGKPMAARMRGGNYSSKSYAKRVGARRLQEFLAALEREQGAK